MFGKIKCGQGVASKPKGRQYFDTKKRSLCNFLPQLHAQKSNEKSLMNFWDNVLFSLGVVPADFGHFSIFST